MEERQWTHRDLTHSKVAHCNELLVLPYTDLTGFLQMLSMVVAVA